MKQELMVAAAYVVVAPRRFCLNFRSYAVAITAISGGCRQDASVPGATA